MGYLGILVYGRLEFIFLGYESNKFLGYGILSQWTIYFGIWDIAYPTNQASLAISTVLLEELYILLYFSIPIRAYLCFLEVSLDV